ncbi:MAG: J domain-containing protein [Bacteroidetes bacterium]|nr:J domain-containing protein [Bacteroidota bacterium]
MDYKDYYKILGVDKSASLDEIKKSYRKLAKEYHPDKTKGNKHLEEKFKEVSEAYQVLGNKENRNKYDDLGANWKQAQQSGGDPGFDFSQFYNQAGGQRSHHQTYQDDPEDFSEFFNNIFGGGFSGFSGQGSGRTRQTQGQDYVADMEITLEEAFHGTSRILQLHDKKLRITTKPGTHHQQKLKLKGKGGPGMNGGPGGDLYITVHVLKHPVFKRKENDLYSALMLDIYTAVLGGKVNVVTLNGNVTLNIPKGTQGAQKLRLKGKGMPVYGQPDQFGNLYVTTQIKIPEHLTPEEEKLFVELKEKSHGQPH